MSSELASDGIRGQDSVIGVIGAFGVSIRTVLWPLILDGTLGLDSSLLIPNPYRFRGRVNDESRRSVGQSIGAGNLADLLQGVAASRPAVSRALFLITYMPLPLADLKMRLSVFTDEVGRSLTYEAARKLLADESSNRHVSYQWLEPQAFELTFLWEVLAIEEVRGKRAARVMTHVCDDRAKGKLGSVWTPLCGGGWIYEDGTFERHPIGNFAAESEDD